jgi:aryl-alcohol dehydrogenase-like predicted oxidoreductase
MRAGQSFSAGDFRARGPRFRQDNLARNLALADRLREVGGEHDATAAQVAIAWALAQGEDIVPLVGARTRERLAEALGALELELSPSDLQRIEAAVPPDAIAGARYPEAQMAHLDSER